MPMAVVARPISKSSAHRKSRDFASDRWGHRDCGFARIGFGWLAQKAVAFDDEQIPAVADKIRNLSLLEYSLDMSALTDTEAYNAWEAAQDSRERARHDVIEWLPSNVVAR